MGVGASTRRPGGLSGAIRGVLDDLEKVIEPAPGERPDQGGYEPLTRRRLAGEDPRDRAVIHADVLGEGDVCVRYTYSASPLL